MIGSKGQKIGTQIAIVIIFLVLIIATFWVFMNPETSMNIIDGLIEGTQDINWNSWEVRILLLIVFIIPVLYLLVSRLTNVFEEMEV